MTNLDPRTVEGFGEEWQAFDQASLGAQERETIFSGYFSLFPWSELPAEARGADLGCGSGRWATLVAPRVGSLLLVDASREALGVAERNLAGFPNTSFHHGSVCALPVPDASLDFAYSLGVLHHLPDTAGAIQAIARKLKPGAPFLVYLYYSFEQRPMWFRALWRLSNTLRNFVCRMPWPAKKAACDLLAAAIYWPLARAALLQEKWGGRAHPSWPLAYYRDKSFYVMRTDSLDRFGTRLEQRFSRAEIERMLAGAGFTDVRFSAAPPFWTAVAHRGAAD